MLKRMAMAFAILAILSGCRHDSAGSSQGQAVFVQPDTTQQVPVQNPFSESPAVPIVGKPVEVLPAKDSDIPEHFTIPGPKAK